jgi:hypothetical protein
MDTAVNLTEHQQDDMAPGIDAINQPEQFFA